MVMNWRNLGCTLLFFVTACDGGPSDETETGAVVDTDRVDTDRVDTDRADTDGLDSDLGDSDAPDTDGVDTDGVDTDGVDTDVMDTGGRDSGGPDSDTGDTALVDTDVTDTGSIDTGLPVLGILPGRYSLDAATRWTIAPGGATTSNVMLLYLRVEIAPTGDVTGSIVNVWTLNEVNVNATCTHPLMGSVLYSPSAHGITVQFTVDSIGDAVCDVPPDSPYQDAWTESMRSNFGWFGFMPIQNVDASWTYANGVNIAAFVSQQMILGQDIRFYALTMGTGDYYNPDPVIAPYAFFGPVEAR
jgi:hypothetical protein